MLASQLINRWQPVPCRASGTCGTLAAHRARTGGDVTVGRVLPTGSVVAILALSAGFFGALSAVLLTVTIVGLPVMMLLLLALRAFARMKRCRLAWVGITVVSPYGRDDPSASWWATLRTRLREPSTWLELASLVVAAKPD